VILIAKPRSNSRALSNILSYMFIIPISKQNFESVLKQTTQTFSLSGIRFCVSDSNRYIST
jgi:hypothetical protein